MIRVDIGDSAELIEVTSHRHHPKVLGGELDLRVIRVQLPVAHGGPPCSPLGLDAAPNMPPGCDRSWLHCCGRCRARAGSTGWETARSASARPPVTCAPPPAGPPGSAGRAASASALSTPSS